MIQGPWDRLPTMAQSVSHLLVHIVFSTKGRAPVLSPEVRKELLPYMAATLASHGCHAIEIGGVEDHLHLLVNIGRTITVAQLVEKLKTSSSKWIKSKWPELGTFAWQGGYGAFSIGVRGQAHVVAYIRGQEEHHKKVSFQEEFRAFLKEVGVEVDERYLWA